MMLREFLERTRKNGIHSVRIVPSIMNAIYYVLQEYAYTSVYNREDFWIEHFNWQYSLNHLQCDQIKIAKCL